MYDRLRPDLRVLLGLYEEEGHSVVRQLEEEARLTDRIVQGRLGLGAVQIRLPQLQPRTRLYEPH